MASGGFTIPILLKVATLVASAHRFLEDAGVIHPDWHAELLVGGCLGMRRHELYIRGEEPVTPDQAKRGSDRTQSQIRGANLLSTFWGAQSSMACTSSVMHGDSSRDPRLRSL